MEHNPVMGHVTPLLSFREDFDVADLLDDSFSGLMRAARLLNYAALALAVLALICLYLRSAVRHSQEQAYCAGIEQGISDEVEQQRRRRKERED